MKLWRPHARPLNLSFLTTVNQYSSQVLKHWERVERCKSQKAKRLAEICQVTDAQE